MARLPFVASSPASEPNPMTTAAWSAFETAPSTGSHQPIPNSSVAPTSAWSRAWSRVWGWTAQGHGSIHARGNVASPSDDRRRKEEGRNDQSRHQPFYRQPAVAGSAGRRAPEGNDGRLPRPP